MRADGDVVDLTVVEAALVAIEYLERLLLGADRGETTLSERERDLLVAAAVQEQERARHLLHDAVEPEAFELLQRCRIAIDAEHPLQVLRRHRQRQHLAGREL